MAYTTKPWKTTNEVIEAVKNGDPCTEDELRYAVQNLSIWQNGTWLTLARAITEDPMKDRTKRELARYFERASEDNEVPLDIRLKGGSFEPGLSRDERLSRGAQFVSDTANRLRESLDFQHQLGKLRDETADR